MALTYGFYDSVSGDRAYNATQMSSLFDGIIEDGVFANIGGHLIVTAQGTGLQVIVAEGRAWFNHTWTLLDADIILTHDAAHVTYPRYDSIVLEVNADIGTRENSIKIVKGTPATSPVPPVAVPYHSGTLHQYPLAQVYIPVGLALITGSNITNKVGTSVCPFVIGAVTSFNIDSLIAQWESEFDLWIGAEQMDWVAWLSARAAEWTSWKGDEQTAWGLWLADKAAEWLAWYEGQGDDFTGWMATQQSDWDSWVDANQSAFDVWWAAFVDNLTTEQATNLQLEINDINAELLGRKKVLTEDKIYYVATTGDDGNDGLTVGTPFLTVQKAIDEAVSFDLGEFNITIQIADGTYTSDSGIMGYLKGFSGNGHITIQGNISTPTNVILSSVNYSIFVTAGGYGTYPAPGGGTYIITGVRMVATQYIASAIKVSNNFKVFVGAVNFGQCGSAHIYVENGGYVQALSPGYTVSGSASNHIYLENGGAYKYLGAGIFFDNIVFSAAVNFSIAFVNLSILSKFSIGNIGFTNSGYVSGKKYIVTYNSVLASGGLTLPGTVSGSTSTGGQYG